MRIEAQVLKGKLVLNSPDPQISRLFLEKLQELGLEVQVLEDTRCG